MYAPMLFPLTGLLSGIICAAYEADWRAAIALILAGVALYLTIIGLSRNPVRGFRIAPLHHVWLFLIFAGTGIFDMDINRPFEDDSMIGSTAAFIGRVESISHKTSGDYTVIDIGLLIDKAGKGFRPDNCKIVIKGSIPPVDVDDVLSVTSTIEKTDVSGHLQKSTYERRLRQQGVCYESLCNEEDVRITGHKRTLAGTAWHIRSDMEAFIEKTPLDKKTQNFLITILLGDRSYLAAELRDTFADAGISHILALSGMHVAIMAGIIMWLLFPMNFAGLYKYRIIVAAVMMAGYALVTGLAPSTVRASVMMLAVSISIFLERRNTAWNSLLLATFCILLVTPGAVFDIGLQLSFTCVASLIFFVRPLNPFSQHDHPRLYGTGTVIITTIVATTATWCLSAYYFGRIPVVFLAANLLTLPLLPAYLVASVIYLAASAITTLPSWSTRLIDLFPDMLQKVISWMTNGGTTAVHFSPSLVSVLAWSVLLMTLALLVNGHRRRLMKYLAPLAALAFIGTIALPTHAEEDNFMVQGGIDKIRIKYLDNGEEETLQMPRYANSEVTLRGKRIICIDDKLQDSINGNGNAEEYDYLILCGSGSKDLQALLTHYRFRKLIIHPTVRKATESAIIKQSDSLRLPVHSIRLSGPYRERLQ